MINPRALRWCWRFILSILKRSIHTWLYQSPIKLIPEVWSMSSSFFSCSAAPCWHVKTMHDSVCNHMQTPHLTPFLCSLQRLQSRNQSKWSGYSTHCWICWDLRLETRLDSLRLVAPISMSAVKHCASVRCREDGVLADFDRGVVERTGNQPKESLVNWIILAMKPRTTIKIVNRIEEI